MSSYLPRIFVTPATETVPVAASQPAKKTPPPVPPKRAAIQKDPPAVPTRPQAKPAAPSTFLAPPSSVASRAKSTVSSKKAAPSQAPSAPVTQAVNPAVLELALPTKKEAKALKRAEKLTPWGMVKMAGKASILGLAGVGGYFAVNSIVHAVSLGLSAKATVILISVGAGVGGALLAVVAGVAIYKGLKKIRKNNEKKAEKIQTARKEALKQFVAPTPMAAA